jgi:hypothetical protein
MALAAQVVLVAAAVAEAATPQVTVARVARVAFLFTIKIKGDKNDLFCSIK